MAMLDEIGAYLATQGRGVVATSIFFGRLPDSPDACIGLFEYGGQEPMQTGNHATPFERPRLQVQVRDVAYQSARNRIQDVWNDLNAIVDVTLSTVRYIAISPLQNPFLLDRDGRDRPVCVFNAEVHRAL